MQDEVLAFLGDPATHGGAAVSRIDTHISAVFLAGDRVLKLKRAVTLPFLDFSAPEQRHRACMAELAINRRTAPQLYLGVETVTREADGSLALGGAGPAVEWVVVMRRFEQDGLFDRLAMAGALGRDEILALADVLADFHERAEPRPAWGGEAGLHHTIDSNDACFALDCPDLFSPELVGRVTGGSRTWLARLAPLLEQRRAAGLVRQCHGDLHLGNICRFEGQVLLFDGIEFNDDFACIDVLYDLAFLLMDLQARGLGKLASWLFNRYLERRNDLAGLAAMPLFLSLRAAIRGHVSAAMARGAGNDPALRAKALDYMTLAEGYLSPPPPRLVAVGGLSGSGKSRLGRDLAPFLGAAPGAAVLRTDVIRKRLMGVAPETRLPVEGYSAEMTERTYQTLYEDCVQALAAGQAVVADAVFAQAEQRAGIEQAARRAGVPFHGVWLDADPDVMRARVESRRKNASDATVAVLERQLTYDLGPMTWLRLDSSASKEETFQSARTVLGL